jgi:hypothetical protein
MSTAVSTAPAATADKRLYKSTFPVVNVISPIGKVMEFRGGLFITDETDLIEYLDDQIAKRAFGGQVYIDPNARTITAEQENPMLALKKKFFEQFQSEQAGFINPSNDMGTSVPGNLNPASTRDIAPVAAGAGPSGSKK